MWLQVRPASSKIRKEIESSSSYINNRGDRPAIGTCISSNQILFSDVKESELKDNQWKFIPIVNEEIKNDFYCLFEIYEDVVMILYP